MSSQCNLFLIIGFPRSGTKLLRNILSNHGQIYITHELLFLPILAANWNSYGDLSLLPNFRKMYDDVMSTYYFISKSKRGGDIISAEEWHRHCRTYDPLTVFSEIIRYETHASDSPEIWLGDKSPNYTTHLPVIKSAIPEARIIHIVRDARDAAISARKIWRKNIYRFVQRWSDGMRALQDDMKGISASDLCEVRYEDLLQYPEETIRKILAFLGLEYQDDILELKKPSENLGDTREESRIVTDNVAKYKIRLEDDEIRRLESLAWDMLKHYEYEVGDYKKTQRIHPLQMAWYMLCDAFNRFLFDLRLKRNPAFIVKSLFSRYRTRM